jgi:hypothetical protein
MVDPRAAAASKKEALLFAPNQPIAKDYKAVSKFSRSDVARRRRRRHSKSSTVQGFTITRPDFLSAPNMGKQCRATMHDIALLIPQLH